jgi:phosphopantothenoylcysteine decarboxylase/phosphopantothenate--cysteine ligase
VTDGLDPRSSASARLSGYEQRRPWRNRRIVLGVSGGIAAYKSVQLARDLTQLGASVDVILTRSATEFVGAVTFEALTGRPVYTQLVATGSALDHPARARSRCGVRSARDRRSMARAAAGRADDLLAAVLSPPARRFCWLPR